jgi:hypothetical protein
MDSLWHYYEDGERRGPVPLSSLIAALSAQPYPHDVQVWRQGLADWQAAGSIAEVARQLPPQRPGPLGRPSPGTRAPAIPFAGAEAIARLYRRLVLVVGLQILLAVARIPVFLLVGGRSSAVVLGLVGLVFGLAILVTAVLLAVTAYQLSAHLASVPILWALIMFVPCLNILGLLLLSAKAQAWCKQYGIRVGFLGPSLESIAELRRSADTSPFD